MGILNMWKRGDREKRAYFKLHGESDVRGRKVFKNVQSQVDHLCAQITSTPAGKKKKGGGVM